MMFMKIKCKEWVYTYRYTQLNVRNKYLYFTFPFMCLINEIFSDQSMLKCKYIKTQGKSK